LSLLLKHIENNDGIVFNAVHNTPRFVLVIDSWHREPIEGIGRE
jgi:hypothetical protein